MNFTEALFLAFAMALDAFLVSFSYGLIIEGKRIFNAFKFAFAFGSFQFIMPVIGTKMSNLFYDELQRFSKFIVFAIFIYLAVKFLAESLKKEEKQNITCISSACLFTLATATSIDAFGAGIALKFMNVSVLMPAILIGTVTFLLSFIGYIAACSIKNLNKKFFGIAGSIIFVYLAIKALF